MYLGSPMGVSVYLNTRCSNKSFTNNCEEEYFCVHLPHFMYGVLLLYGVAINIFFSLLSKYFGSQALRACEWIQQLNYVNVNSV